MGCSKHINKFCTMLPHPIPTHSKCRTDEVTEMGEAYILHVAYTAFIIERENVLSRCWRCCFGRVDDIVAFMRARNVLARAENCTK